jgi:maltose alpha-D-glucosyltransferase/alpha-amylase
VASQRDDPSSLLNQVHRMIQERRAHPEIGWGSCTVLDPGDAAVLALCQTWKDRRIVSLHNIADRPATARIDLDHKPKRVRRIIADLGAQPIDSIDQAIQLDPFGFCWLELID